MSVLVIRPIRVAVDGSEEGGFLVLNDDVLVAVLTCLANPMHEDETGHWYLEAGFGRCAGRQDTFVTLEAALRWVAVRLGLDPVEATAGTMANFVPPPGCR